MEKWNNELSNEGNAEANTPVAHESVVRKVIKNAAIAGIVGMTQLSGVQESSAADGAPNNFGTKENTVARVVEVTKQAVDNNVKRPTRFFVEAIKGDFQKLKELVKKKDAAKEAKTLGLDMTLFADAQYTWGVEYVPKTNEKGSGVLAERYLKIDNKTGERTILAESAKVYELRETLSNIEGVPDIVLRHASVAANVLDKEKSFVASGFVAPESTKKAVGTEVRVYNGWKNTVEIDEDGKVVKLLHSEPPVEQSPEKK